MSSFLLDIYNFRCNLSETVFLRIYRIESTLCILEGRSFRCLHKKRLEVILPAETIAAFDVIAGVIQNFDDAILSENSRF